MIAVAIVKLWVQTKTMTVVSFFVGAEGGERRELSHEGVFDRKFQKFSRNLSTEFLLKSRFLPVPVP